MKVFYSSNDALLELLSQHGIAPICNDKMQITITDDEAERIPGIVNEFAPAAIGDYSIEDTD